MDDEIVFTHKTDTPANYVLSDHTQVAESIGRELDEVILGELWTRQ